MRKVIISVAPVEAGTAIDKEALVEDVAECAKRGAAMCHLHCRSLDGRLTKNTGELEDIFDQIAMRTDLICQVSTGGVSDMSIEERCRPLQYPGAESASLNGGSTNLGEAVYINSFADIRIQDTINMETLISFYNRTFSELSPLLTMKIL